MVCGRAMHSALVRERECSLAGTGDTLDCGAAIRKGTIMFQLKFYVRCVVSSVVAISLTCIGGQADAQTHGLQDLIATSGDFTVEDKRFFDFSYNAVGEMPPADMVDVIEIVDGDGNPGIRFQGAFIDSTFTAGGSDALIVYRVESLGPLITDIHLSGNPNLLGTAGSISVTEEVFGVNANGSTGPLIARVDIFEDGNAGFKEVDWADFSQPWQAVEVVKDILAFAGNGDVTLSRIDQTFSQVPEPAMSVSTLCGVVALVAILQRRLRRLGVRPC